MRFLKFGVVVVMAGWFLSGLLPAVEIGTPRVNVLEELGVPTSAIGRGDLETLTYKNGVRIKLRNKRVVEIIGLKGVEQKIDTPQKVPVAEPVDPVMTKQEASEIEVMEKEQAETDSAARAKMEKLITDVEGGHDRQEPAPVSFNFTPFLIGLVVKCLLTLAALKLSCKYWNSEVFWSGLLTVAGVDVVVRGVIGYVGFQLLHVMSLFYADEAVASIVMVLLLRKVSINQRMSLAIEVVLTTKTFSIVVGSFLVTVLMRSLA